MAVKVPRVFFSSPARDHPRRLSGEPFISPAQASRYAKEIESAAAYGQAARRYPTFLY